ncbi:ribonuclease H-like domain-containing protein [Tanacetum coccineum]|uniref:Ribonuclease H-like domain-containing protein n=1 Tax=Tanacetum coccineum TaxID=301880 RepID=A0ABQ5IIV9_9ASTR
MTGPELTNIDELLSKLIGQLGLNNKLSPTNTSHSSKSPTVSNPIHVANPNPPHVAYHATAGPNMVPPTVSPAGPTGTPRQETTLPHAFTTGTLHDPASGAWNFDTGASSHLNNSVTNVSEVFNSCMYPSVSVGDGHAIPVTNTGHSILPTSVRPLHLNNVLITPHIVKNLIYVRQFVRGDLYSVTHPSPIPRAFLVSQHTWHQRLGHPGGDVLRRLVSNNVISCNNEKPPVLCHACQLGKHVRLPFVSSNTVVTSCFDIIHSDVWTSPIPSLSGFKYYVLFLDHYSQFVWVYLLLNKSDVWSKFVLFRTYVRTQFKCEIRSFQCDHGGEFDNRNLHKLFAENGDPKGGKITGKGKISTGKLDFEDVYFVKELKINLFSVSQMCDKKNIILFTDTECVVLSLDFKLLDENHVLLRVPRKDSMYSVDLKNIVPSGVEGIEVNRLEEDDMAGQAPPQGSIPDLRSMEELLQAPIDCVGDAIVVPPILANHFELKTGLLNLVTAISFHGFENDDPHSHIRCFTKITQTVKLNQAPPNVIKLMLFPFSLEGAAQTWLEKEPSNSITTWNDLVSKLVNHFFPPSKTTNLRNEITRFQQRFGEPFAKAWDRFKDLLNKCPHHGFSPLHQIDTFYNSLSQADQDSLNSAVGGNFLTKNTQEALTIIKNKSKVQTFRNKPQVASANGRSAQDAHISSLTKQVEALLALHRPVDSVQNGVNFAQNGCETCGGPHPYFECQATGGYTQDVYATSGTYNQGGNSYQPQEMMNQHMKMTKARMQQMQEYNNLQLQQLKNHNTNMANKMDQMQKVLMERPQGVLPSNTVPNPREDLKAITTWSGVTLAGPSVPPPPLSSSKEMD